MLRHGMLIIKEKIDLNEIGKEIIKRVFENRLRMNKNSFTMIVGDSGQGKSYTALKFSTGCLFTGPIFE
jgi:ABC-type nitrate/sulfonate/bicarbonate transport system ATPase subunit